MYPLKYGMFFVVIFSFLMAGCLNEDEPVGCPFGLAILSSEDLTVPVKTGTAITFETNYVGDEEICWTLEGKCGFEQNASTPSVFFQEACYGDYVISARVLDSDQTIICANFLEFVIERTTPDSVMVDILPTQEFELCL
jgi:hypothetical protein